MVPREARGPDFFSFFFHSHVATPTEFTSRWVVSRNPAFPGHQTLVIPVHPGLRDFQDFFSTKTFYIRVYHDRITRQKMTSIRIIFEEKN